MLKKIAVRLFVLVAALGLFPAPSSAQFTPRSLGDPATGEDYHIEASVGLWHPTADMSITSESEFNIAGTLIDFKKDLGLTDSTFKELHVVVKPTRRNKLRFQYIPINFEQEATLTRDIIFQGIRYRVGLPVNSQLDWKAYRFAYEFDFISRNRGFAGLILDAKYTDVFAALQSPIDSESLHARAPIPTIGGIGRYYVVPNISITGELTGFKIPDSISEDYKGHYVDLDIYGTVNFTNNFGAQIGYRSFDLGYTVKDDNVVTDSGSFVLKGLYFGAVARF
jgi:hypothetical protein